MRGQRHDRSGIVRLGPLGAVVLLAVLPTGGAAQEATLRVRADQPLGRTSRHLTGACIEDVNHEIYGGLYSQLIFGESFQEPPPASPIAGFAIHGGRWQVRDGSVHVDAADGPKLVSHRPAVRDGEVGVELYFAERRGDNAGLIVRVAEAGVGADRFLGYEVALSPTRQSLRLARHRNNYEPIRDVGCAVAVGRWVPLVVRLAGTTIEVRVDGKTVLRHDDGPRALPAGRVGLRGWQCRAAFRNLWVKTGAEAEPLPLRQPDAAAEVSGMWRPVHTGTASGQYALTADRPFAGTQSQLVRFDAGEGMWGVENQGLNRWGIACRAGRPYEGTLWVRAEAATPVTVALESRDGTRSYAERRLPAGGADWQRLDFTLTPSAADPAGRFAVKLTRPGAVVLGHAFLQPGAWGRYRDLPVRRDVVEGLLDQGITVLRYGGSMVNNPAYRWKKMIGPRDRRPPYRGTWYPHSTNGWGIIDFLNLCEAAGFESIPAFSADETPQDLADFIEYAKGSAQTRWGRQRITDGHPAPYRLRYLEYGNEERVDDRYAARFEAVARAVWAIDRDLILVVGDFLYNHSIRDPEKVTGAASGITNLAGHRRILQLAREHGREVWFDVHVDTEGPGLSASVRALPSYLDALARGADGARHRVAVFELNANNHSVRRALGNAVALHAIERDGRVPIVTSANGLQPDGQNDNGWNQGLLFLNPTQVWLQPPGHVTRMLARNYLPRTVRCVVDGAGTWLDVHARRSDDGRTLLVQVVNLDAKPRSAALRLDGYTPADPVAQVTTLSGPLDGVNTAARPDAVVPRQHEWRHGMKDGVAQYTFAPHSFTLIRFGPVADGDSVP